MQGVLKIFLKGYFFKLNTVPHKNKKQWRIYNINLNQDVRSLKNY